MSTDPKIDLFARDLFNALWQHHGLIPASAPPAAHHPPIITEFNENVFRAVQVRQAMFHPAYEAIFENTYVEFAGNASYFSDAIADFFPHYLDEEEEDHEEESVMCTFLSSCAFVADMCMLSRTRGDHFLDVADQAWAMFADLNLIEAFYAAGGWKELQFFARSEAVYDYVRSFSDVVDCDLGKEVMFHATHLTCAAVDSFNEFEDWEGAADDEEDAPYALNWVDFCVRVPFVKIRSPDHYSQPIPSVFDKLEAAIWALNYICDPLEEDDFSDDYDDDFDATGTGLTGRYFKKILGLDDSANCATNNETLRTTSSSVSYHDMDQEKIDSDIGNFGQVAFVKKLPSSEEQTDSKVLKTKTEESIIYNKSISPVVNPGLESKVEGALSSLFSHETLTTPYDLSNLCSENDRDDTQPKTNTNPDDFDTVVHQLRQKKLSDSKSRVKVFVKTVHHDNTSVPDESVKKSPKPGLSSPRKSPLTSPTINVLNTPDRTLLRRMNSTGSDGMKRKRSTGKENSPSHQPKTDINKKNNTPHQKHFMATESPNLGIKATGQKLKENQEDKYTKRNSLSPDHLSSETSISIDQSLPIPKFISLSRNLYSIRDETGSSKDDQYPSLPDEGMGEDEKLKNLDNSGQIWSEKSSSTHKFVQTSSCLKVPHQNSILTNDDENYHILEKSLTVFGPAKKNDLSRPAIEKEYERSDRRTSQDSSSTEIYDVTEDEKSSAEPSVENQFQSGAGAISKSSLKTKLYYGNLLGKAGYKMPSVKPTIENPIGFDDKEEKKSEKDLNSNDSNREALQNTPVLENPVKPQDVKKRKKKKGAKKRLTRLEQRIKEEGNGVLDVTRLIFVMGHRPGMASVASAFHDSKKQKSEGDNNGE